MFSANKTEAITQKIFEALPPGLQTLGQETQAQLQEFIQDCFAKMSLVTRQEFEIQSQVLAKTRQKLEDLEAKLFALNASDSENPPPYTSE